MVLIFQIAAAIIAAVLVLSALEMVFVDAKFGCGCLIVMAIFAVAALFLFG